MHEAEREITAAGLDILLRSSLKDPLQVVNLLSRVDRLLMDRFTRLR